MLGLVLGAARVGRAFQRGLWPSGLDWGSEDRMRERSVGFVLPSPSHLKRLPSLPLLFALATFPKAAL